jgi:hypothetical protein
VLRTGAYAIVPLAVVLVKGVVVGGVSGNCWRSCCGRRSDELAAPATAGQLAAATIAVIPIARVRAPVIAKPDLCAPKLT